MIKEKVIRQEYCYSSNFTQEFKLKMAYTMKIDNGRCVYQTRIDITYNGSSKIAKKKTQIYIMGCPKSKYKKSNGKTHTYIYITLTKWNQPDSVPPIKLGWSGLFDANQCP